jgi:hypothetical protein
MIAAPVATGPQVRMGQMPLSLASQMYVLMGRMVGNPEPAAKAMGWRGQQI